MQLYVAVTRLNLPFNVQHLERCLADLHTWFCLKGLTLKPDKLKTIIFGTHSLSLKNIDVAGCKVPISPHAKILGATLDSTLSLIKHVTTLSKACYFHILPLRHMRICSHRRLRQTHCLRSRRISSRLCQRSIHRFFCI